MTQLLAERRDIDFVLHEQLNIEQLYGHKQFTDLNRKTVDLVINEARNLAVHELLPARESGDREGARFEHGNVFLPESFYRVYEKYCEGEWIGITEDPEWGGQGLPAIIGVAAHDYFIGANYPFMMFPGSTHGVGALIEAFGTGKQKELFLKKLYSGVWTATMVLTEPHAGSDIGELSTKAVKNEAGTYSITGNKIFITSADQDITENIVHPVLARVEGASEGSRGVSLFLVPKIWVNEDGSLGEFNHVVCTGIEEKLGLKGSPTCSVALGEKGPCRGMLLGEENRGLSNMFILLNEARLLVGQFGLACASTSYLYALDYARKRIQGKHLLNSRDKGAPSVPIIQHPDIRRQLLTMKTYVEGMRSFIYYVALITDQMEISEDMDEINVKQNLINLLTPVVKGYVSDKSFDLCSLGVQIHGGYGYTRKFPVGQLLRDCRVAMIYEGANGIQAIDLLRKKLGMNNGATLSYLLAQIQNTIGKAKTIASLEAFAEKYQNAVKRFEQVASHIQSQAKTDNVMNAFAFAYPFMQVFGDVIVGWMLLWRAVIATKKQESGAVEKDIAFYEGQLKSAQYFFNTELPVTLGKMNAILETDGSAVEISEKSFGI